MDTAFRRALLSVQMVEKRENHEQGRVRELHNGRLISPKGCSSSTTKSGKSIEVAVETDGIANEEEDDDDEDDRICVARAFCSRTARIAEFPAV